MFVLLDEGDFDTLTGGVFASWFILDPKEPTASAVGFAETAQRPWSCETARKYMRISLVQIASEGEIFVWRGRLNHREFRCPQSPLLGGSSFHLLDGLFGCPNGVSHEAVIDHRRRVAVAFVVHAGGDSITNHRDCHPRFQTATFVSSGAQKPRVPE
jgi:hypothetical protein